MVVGMVKDGCVVGLVRCRWVGCVGVGWVCDRDNANLNEKIKSNVDIEHGN